MEQLRSSTSQATWTLVKKMSNQSKWRQKCLKTTNPISNTNSYYRNKRLNSVLSCFSTNAVRK